MKIRELLLLEIDAIPPGPGNQEIGKQLQNKINRIGRLKSERDEPLPPNYYSNKVNNPDIPLK